MSHRNMPGSERRMITIPEKLTQTDVHTAVDFLCWHRNRELRNQPPCDTRTNLPTVTGNIPFDTLVAVYRQRFCT